MGTAHHTSHIAHYMSTSHIAHHTSHKSTSHMITPVHHSHMSTSHNSTTNISTSHSTSVHHTTLSRCCRASTPPAWQRSKTNKVSSLKPQPAPSSGRHSAPPPPTTTHTHLGTARSLPTKQLVPPWPPTPSPCYSQVLVHKAADPPRPYGQVARPLAAQVPAAAAMQLATATPLIPGRRLTPLPRPLP